MQASLEAADAARQSHRRAVHNEALTVAIDPTALFEQARVDGRDEVAAIMVETARRRMVISDATAYDIDIDAVVRAAEARETGSWFPAVEAALKRLRTAEEAAPWLDLDVKAFCASARSQGEDPVRGRDGRPSRPEDGRRLSGAQRLLRTRSPARRDIPARSSSP